ncbi:MAG: lipocalin family protein [Gemmatimonadota bacterium]|nr:MAG: lipocalin family protein [Gemmatimonadota bacterium]
MDSNRLTLVRGVALAAAVLALATAHGQELGPPATVERVELERYVGLWYEIARIPNSFQDQCARDVTAEYALRDDGRLDVINRCVKSDGRVDEAKGLARIEDRESNSKLKVSFFSILGWRPVWGDYWIIGLGDDYEYAVVGSPDRKYGWILSRERELDAVVLERIFATLGERGYEPDGFQMTAQETPPGG